MTKAVLAPLAAAAILVSACGGGGTSGPFASRTATSIATDGTIHAASARVSRNDAGSILLELESGPMSGMNITCTDANMGACTVNGGPQGTTANGRLLHRYRGQFAFVGHFSILQLTNGEFPDMVQLAHAPNPNFGASQIWLPNTNNANYTGSFHAGVGLADGTGGLAQGTASLIANFNAGVLSGTMSGGFEDGPGINASFNNVTINASNGQFTATENTLIMFQGDQAWGSLDGAFYGPNANEGAGIFDFGNDHGGMNGIFLTCAGSMATCIND